jgi:invasion protein IalB
MTLQRWAMATVVATTALGLAMAGAKAAGAPAQAGRSEPKPLKIASLVDDGDAAEPGDILRTTRMFPNWNLNCEVLLSQGKHLCAVELRSVDRRGQQVLSWSIALSASNDPIMVLRMPSDIDRSYGLRMTIGAFTTLLVPQPSDCTPTECRMIAPFEAALRTLMVSQAKVTFALAREGQTLTIEAPLDGMSEALATARRDPIGLLATQKAKTPKPSMAALKLRASQAP